MCLYLPWPYLIGLLVEATDVHDNRFVEPVILGAEEVAGDAAVPGLVGGFIPRGAWGRSGAGLKGGGRLGASDDVSTVKVVGLGGNGLFGGADELLLPGLDPSKFNGGGLFGASFAGGVGGTAHLLTPFSSCRASSMPISSRFRFSSSPMTGVSN
jgi:hypothetical protein